MAVKVGNEVEEDRDGEDGGPVGKEVRKRLGEWWAEEYCAGRMKLCVVGNRTSQPCNLYIYNLCALESLDELSSLVTGLFSPVLNLGLDTSPTVHPHPYSSAHVPVCRILY